MLSIVETYSIADTTGLRFKCPQAELDYNIEASKKYLKKTVGYGFTVSQIHKEIDGTNIVVLKVLH